MNDRGSDLGLLSPRKSRLTRDVMLGLALALFVLSTIVMLGSVLGKKPVKWVCDDTTFTRTGPVGSDVVGPTVRPIPGCY
jgi:hypothetical protein